MQYGQTKDFMTPIKDRTPLIDLYLFESDQEAQVIG